MTRQARAPKLWFVSELYYPEETSTGYFVTRIAEGLAARREVRVLCAQPTYSERHLDAPRRERRGGTEIDRVWSTRFEKDRLIGRVVNMLTFTLAITLSAALKLKRGDSVIVLTNPPTLPVIIAMIARVKRARAILLVHDVYPEVLRATGHLDGTGFPFRLLERASRAIYRRFDDIIVLGRDMQALFASKLAGSATRLTLIPNWGDVDDIRPIDRRANGWAREHGLIGKTVIQFSGNLGRTHDIESVLRVAHSLRDRADIVFLFVGYGGKAALIAETREAEAATNIVALPRQPRAALAEMLNCADASVIAFVPNMLGVSTPSRMYNIMAAGVPIIAMADELAELAIAVREEDAGWVVRLGDEASLRALVVSIADGREDARGKGANGRSAAERTYNPDAVIARFETMLDRGLKA